MTLLTRSDQIMGTAYDSIKWAIEEHMKETDTGEFHSGVLHGNEDAPLRIQLWRDPEPAWDAPPDRDWKPPVEEAEHEQAEEPAP